MNTKPSELNRLIESRGLQKKAIARNIDVPMSYIAHALNVNSPRYKTAKMQETREKIYAFLINLKAIL